MASVPGSPPRRKAEQDVSRFLMSDEKALIALHEHPILIGKQLGAALAAVILFLVVLTGGMLPQNSIWILLVITLALVVRALLAYDQWRRKWFVITDKRILLVTSFIQKTVTYVSTSRITHMTFDQPVLGHILGFVHFDFQSAGSDSPLYRAKYIIGGSDTYLAVVDAVTNGEPVEYSKARRRNKAYRSPYTVPSTTVPTMRDMQGGIQGAIQRDDDPTSRPILPGARTWYQRLRRGPVEEAPSTATGARHHPVDDDDYELDYDERHDTSWW